MEKVKKSSSATSRAVAKLVRTHPDKAEMAWRQAKEFVKTTGHKGRWDLVLKTCLEMLKYEHNIKETGEFSWGDLKGILVESSSTLAVVRCQGEDLVMPLISLAFSEP